MTFFRNADSVRADGILLRIKDTNIGCFIIRLEARLRPNVGNAMARFDGVHAFGNNSGESETDLDEMWSTLSSSCLWRVLRPIKPNPKPINLIIM